LINSKVLYGVKVKNSNTGLYTVYIYTNKHKAEQVKKGIAVLKRIIQNNNMVTQNQIDAEMYSIFEGYITFVDGLSRHNIQKVVKYGKEVEVLSERVYGRQVRVI